MEDKFLFRLTKGQTFTIVAQDGSANALDPGLPEELLLKMYRYMVQGRLYDEKSIKLQAAGRMSATAKVA